ncbi:putative SOS response-associated peptidase YedK [Variovorax sp. GrIS 2.14]
MCNQYVAPDEAEMERFWHFGPTNKPPLFPRQVFPRSRGPFIRRARHSTGYERELVTGQWALIPWFAKEPKLKFPTNNARSEELAEKASYKDPWKRGQRCIIPAASFDETQLGDGKEHLVAVQPRRWGAVGFGGPVERLDRQRHR